MDWAYTAFGLRLLADGEIPGLASCAAAPAYDVRIWLNKMPASLGGGERICWYQSNEVDTQELPSLTIWRTVPEGAFHFIYADRTEFLIRQDGSEVWCVWPEEATIADTVLYLRGPILSMVLRLRGGFTLHASAIAVHQSAIAMVGYHGAGKSTTAAGFAKLGYAILADDVAALEPHGGTFRVLPGFPRLSLWPDAAQALYGSADSIPRLAPSNGMNHGWDKRYVDLKDLHRFQPDPLPLAALYILGERASDQDAPLIDPLSGQGAIIALADQTYMNYALDETMRAAEFRTLAQLARMIPVRLVTPQSDPARVLDLCGAILRDYNEVAGVKATCDKDGRGPSGIFDNPSQELRRGDVACRLGQPVS